MNDPNSRWNARAYIWHGFWAALMLTFTEVNTVLPALIVSVGGTQIQVGILTGIMVGVPMLGQLLFAGMLSSRIYKKPYLLTAIHLRVLALAGVSYTIYLSLSWSGKGIILFIYAWMFLFALSGAFAGISYMDILGKSVEGEHRRRFLVQKQFLASTGVFFSALIAREILRRLDHPQNYMILFAAAAGCLLVATTGFWVLRERPTQVVLERGSLFDIFRFIPKYLREDRNLRNFVILNNLAGFSVTLAPFYIVLARDRYSLDAATVGNFLMISIIGLVVSNYLWSKIIKRYAYRGVLISWVLLAASVPALALILSSTAPLSAYLVIFFLGGAAVSAQRISQEGILLEISDETTRALYTGINGAFNLSIALFPLISGILITMLGYAPIFILGSLSMFAALFFARRIDCSVTA